MSQLKCCLLFGLFQLIKMRARLAVVTLLFLLGGCQLLTPSHEASSIRSEPFFNLSGIPKTMQNRAWLDKFSLIVNRGTEQEIKKDLLLKTELTNSDIRVAAMTFSGMPVAQLSWNSVTRQLKSESTVQGAIVPELILLDLQSVNWPLDVLVAEIKEGYSLKESKVSDIIYRRIYQADELIIEIKYDENIVYLEQLKLGYRIEVNRLEDTLLKTVLNTNNQ